MFNNLFKSKEERKKEEDEYKKKMFPLGDSQKNLAMGLLKSLISNKSHDNEILFYFLVCKEKYMDNGEEAIKNLHKYIIKSRMFSLEEANIIISCAILDLKAPSLDEYPTKEEVLEYIKGGDKKW